MKRLGSNLDHLLVKVSVCAGCGSTLRTLSLERLCTCSPCLRASPSAPAPGVIGSLTVYMRMPACLAFTGLAEQPEAGK